jgi:hypothetical protein
MNRPLDSSIPVPASSLSRESDRIVSEVRGELRNHDYINRILITYILYYNIDIFIQNQLDH